MFLVSQPGLVVTRLEMKLNPYGRTPLAAEVQLETSRPCRVSQVRIVGGVTSNLASTPLSTTHSVPILGLRPDHEQEVVLTLEDGHGRKLMTRPRRVHTAPLPEDFPKFRVLHPAGNNFGFTLTFVSVRQQGEFIPKRGYLVILDPGAEVVWFQRLEALINELKMTESGELQLQDLLAGRIWSQDLLGRVGWEFRTFSQEEGGGGVAVATDTFHHDFQFQDGLLWTLGTRVVDEVVEDLVLGVDREGKVRVDLSLCQALDPQRRIYPQEKTGLWDWFYKKNLYDWGHANSLVVSARSFLVSLRHQDAVVEFDRESGRPNWILASPEQWSEEFEPLRLQPQGEVTWPRRQHSARWSRRGTLLLFDNGRQQSRVVEFMVDPINMKVRQLWEFRDQQPFFSRFLGEVDESADGNTLIITDGGRISPQGEFWGRVVEVSRDTPPRVLYELEIRCPGGAGCSVYRSERCAGLY